VHCFQAPAAFHWSSSGTTLLVMDSRVHSPTLRGGPRIDPAVEIAAMRLAEATDAEAIILFGSRARGDNDDESDWDLCVILPDTIEWGRFTPITLWSLVSDLGIPIQVVPIRRSVFEDKKTGINTLSHDIARDGLVIHGRLERSAAPWVRQQRGWRRQRRTSMLSEGP
jgi:uncharacterized protein